MKRWLAATGHPEGLRLKIRKRRSRDKQVVDEFSRFHPHAVQNRLADRGVEMLSGSKIGMSKSGGRVVSGRGRAPMKPCFSGRESHPAATPVAQVKLKNELRNACVLYTLSGDSNMPECWSGVG